MVLSRHYSKVEKLQHVEFIMKQKQMTFKNLKVSFVPKRLVMVPEAVSFVGSFCFTPSHTST